MGFFGWLVGEWSGILD